MIVSAVTAGIGGNVTGAAGEMATRATVTYLQGLAAKEIKTLGENLDPASKATLHAIAGCAGGAAAGGSCDAGAMGAAAGSLLGSLLATTDKPGQPLSQSEREARVNLITSIAAGVTAGTGGDVATASSGAKAEAETIRSGLWFCPCHRNRVHRRVRFMAVEARAPQMNWILMAEATEMPNPPQQDLPHYAKP